MENQTRLISFRGVQNCKKRSKYPSERIICDVIVQ
jgi:hypothetical protein